MSCDSLGSATVLHPGMKGKACLQARVADQMQVPGASYQTPAQRASRQTPAPAKCGAAPPDEASSTPSRGACVKALLPASWPSLPLAYADSLAQLQKNC